MLRSDLPCLEELYRRAHYSDLPNARIGSIQIQSRGKSVSPGALRPQGTALDRAISECHSREPNQAMVLSVPSAQRNGRRFSDQEFQTQGSETAPQGRAFRQACVRFRIDGANC